MILNKITPYKYINYWLKSLNTTSFELINDNSRKMLRLFNYL